MSGGCLNGGGQIPAPKVPGSSTQATRKERLDQLEQLLHGASDAAFVPPLDHPLLPSLHQYIFQSSGIGRGKKSAPSIHELVGGPAVRSWLSAEWRSLKIDSDGKEVVATSALKW